MISFRRLYIALLISTYFCSTSKIVSASSFLSCNQEAQKRIGLGHMNNWGYKLHTLSWHIITKHKYITFCSMNRNYFNVYFRVMCMCSCVERACVHSRAHERAQAQMDMTLHTHNTAQTHCNIYIYAQGSQLLVFFYWSE